MSLEHKARVDIYGRKPTHKWIWIVIAIAVLIVFGALRNGGRKEPELGTQIGPGLVGEGSGSRPAAPPTPPIVASLPRADALNPFVEDVASTYAFSRPTSWSKVVEREPSGGGIKVSAWRDNRQIRLTDGVSVASRSASMHTFMYHPDHVGADLKSDTSDILRYIADDDMKIRSQSSVVVDGTPGLLTIISGKLYDGDHDGTIHKVLTVARPQGLFMLKLYCNPQDLEVADEILRRTIASIRFL